MLCPGVTQEWVDDGELLRERTKNQRWQRPYEVLAEATHGEVRESIGHKRGRGGGEYRGKLHVPRQGGRTEAKKLYKTGVDGLLIKIAESEGLRVDARVLDQEIK
ncbi:hypothetical protein B296_00015511 [Ensete ventricosum]|uniref:Uncharacterized protein n=1 Tax=Ensete ventricosum TaxID=4639 RepID=A0A426ZTH6_ENSVE|nr:hypothetical protein B296_00015511 [Ensete ventricosum]